MNRSTNYIIGCFIIGLALVWVAKITSETALTIKNKGYIVVKGFASKEIKSDLGIFKASIIAQDKDLKLCYKKMLESRNKLEAFLKSFGLKDGKWIFAHLQLKEIYKLGPNGYETDEFVEYKITQDIQIEDKDVNKIANLVFRVSELLDQDVKIFIYSPQYIYSKLDELKVTILGKAMANARERALNMAREGKFRLNTVATVRAGVFQITPLHSTEVEDSGINDTTSIDKEIKSVVEVQYLIR